MPPTKTAQFTKNELEISLTARALAHPARVRIVQLLQQNYSSRNIDLSKELKLSKSSVSNHIGKLKDAKLIHVNYLPNSLFITLNEKKIEKWFSIKELMI